MYKLLCTAEFDDHWGQEIARFAEMQRVGFSLDMHPASRMNETDITKALQGQDIFICGYEKITQQVLRNCPDLKLILSVRDGPEENIDIETCTRMGIPVLFSGGRCERSVPEFTFAVLLLMAKPIIKSNRVFREEKWSPETDLKIRRICESSTELSGKVLGIVGLGRNGKGLARRALAFDMEIIAYDPYIDQHDAEAMGVRLVELEELMGQSDYVTVLARVTEESRGMIGRNQIAMMKQGACLVNTARAALVDQDAQFEALRDGRIRAALDVFSLEPPPADSPVYSIPEDNLLITTHLAGLSIERIVYQSKKLHDFLFDYLHYGTIPENISNKQVLETPVFEKQGKQLLGVLQVY